ncbi:pyrroline-5-carboxylate reductase [Candidatus Micrarchaeota archaeon]|nr:pyrroline-5-carboxylate reductase [Candidatus Micrarchaeota archaeon]
MRIAIIGVGRLGSVFARVFTRGHELLLVDRDFENAREVASELGALPVKDLAQVKTCDLVVIAVKPAHVEEVVKQVRDAPLIVSCAAGITIRMLESFGAQRVIRVMPNICAEVGEAVIAYALHPEVEKKEKVFLTAFSSLGLCIKTDESHLDTITATSGSGPAFVAYFAQAMIDEAVKGGLARETAEKCVAQTFLGTGKLMLSGWSAEKVVSTVASPDGTTEAGLRMLKEKGADKAIHEAIRFAESRTREMGKKG